MNTASLNNLWNYLQGLPLTKSNWRWIAEKTSEMSKKETPDVPQAQNIKYRISPRMQKLMGSIHIDPKDIENDDRLRYLLSK